MGYARSAAVSWTRNILKLLGPYLVVLEQATARSPCTPERRWVDRRREIRETLMFLVENKIVQKHMNTTWKDHICGPFTFTLQLIYLCICHNFCSEITGERFPSQSWLRCCHYCIWAKDQSGEGCLCTICNAVLSAGWLAVAYKFSPTQQQ